LGGLAARLGANGQRVANFFRDIFDLNRNCHSHKLSHAHGMHMFCIFCIPAVDNHRTLFRYHPGEAAEFYQATPPGPTQWLYQPFC